jgi:hypothetical protein
MKGDSAKLERTNSTAPALESPVQQCPVPGYLILAKPLRYTLKSDPSTLDRHMPRHRCKQETPIRYTQIGKPVASRLLALSVAICELYPRGLVFSDFHKHLGLAMARVIIISE